MHVILRTCCTHTVRHTGTLIVVVGSLGSVDVYGIPTSSYAIDGIVLANYTAPVIDSSLFQSDVTFFTSPYLTAGTHNLVITNLNGTAPNIFWIDYLMYAPSTTAMTSDPAKTTDSVTFETARGIFDSTWPAAPSNKGAIAGGVVISLVGLVFLAGFAWWWWLIRQRQGNGASPECKYLAHPWLPLHTLNSRIYSLYLFSCCTDIRPFAAWRGDGPTRRTSILSASSAAPAVPLPPQTTENPEANTPPAQSDPILQTGWPTAIPAFCPNTVATRQTVQRTSRLSGKNPPSTRTTLPFAPAVPTVVQETDSGVRAVGPGVTILPPPYTRH